MTDSLLQEAITTLGAWVDEARAAGEVEPTAMTVASVAADGQPSARVVLLKQLDARGVVFYTNYDSRKGKELQGDPRAAAVFYFSRLDRQVRVEGQVEPVSDAEADAYFASRHRGSQIGAWASAQSRPINHRSELEARIAELESKYEGQTVPRPPHWSGFRLIPSALELWQGREHRIHERWRYENGAAGWQKMLLQP
ncbi:MAG: pyridoxamine 5'-phosphate oxidase [Pseudomonadota bacterium]